MVSAGNSGSGEIMDLHLLCGWDGLSFKVVTSAQLFAKDIDSSSQRRFDFI